MAPLVPASLVRYLRDKRCVLFAGAGLSASAGLPGWKKLLTIMAKEVESEDGSSSVGAELQKLIEAGKLLEVADHARQRLGERRYLELLGEQLRGGSGAIPEVHHLVVQLPFTAVVTTNYDKLLERAYTQFRGDLPKVVTSRDRESLGSLLFSGAFFILKAHGDIDDAESLVLTAHDYRAIIHSNPAFDAFFSALLMTRSVLFAGYSLGDPDFRLLLDRQLSAFGDNIPERYALMSGVGPVESDVLRRSANIRVLPYEEGKHDEAERFLRVLLERVSAAETATSPPGVPPRVAPSPEPVSATIAETRASVDIAGRSSPSSTPAPKGSVLAPVGVGGAELQLTARDDRLEALLRTEQGQSVHLSDSVRWSLLYRRLASLIGDEGSNKRDRLATNYRRAGAILGALLPGEALAALPRDRVLALSVGDELREIPWELALCREEPLALARPVIRAATAARGLPGVRQPVRVLVIGDPGADASFRLPGAYEEAAEIAAMYREPAQCTMLGGAEATLDTVMDALSGTAWDVVHFAGHAWFDRQESYLGFGREDRITASELRSLLAPQPPATLVLNSHYTAFLPRGMRPRELREQGTGESELPPTSHIGFMGMALAAGVGTLLGCFASPMDVPAKMFGMAVHRELLAGATIANAVHRARQAVHAADKDDVSMLQYVLSGHPGYRVVGDK